MRNGGSVKSEKASEASPHSIKLPTGDEEVRYLPSESASCVKLLQTRRLNFNVSGRFSVSCFYSLSTLEDPIFIQAHDYRPKPLDAPTWVNQASNSALLQYPRMQKGNELRFMSTVVRHYSARYKLHWSRKKEK